MKPRHNLLKSKAHFLSLLSWLTVVVSFVVLDYPTSKFRFSVTADGSQHEQKVTTTHFLRIQPLKSITTLQDSSTRSGSVWSWLELQSAEQVRQRLEELRNLSGESRSASSYEADFLTFLSLPLAPTVVASGGKTSSTIILRNISTSSSQEGLLFPLPCQVGYLWLNEDSITSEKGGRGTGVEVPPEDAVPPLRPLALCSSSSSVSSSSSSLNSSQSLVIPNTTHYSLSQLLPRQFSTAADHDSPSVLPLKVVINLTAVVELVLRNETLVSRLETTVRSISSSSSSGGGGGGGAQLSSHLNSRSTSDGDGVEDLGLLRTSGSKASSFSGEVSPLFDEILAEALYDWYLQGIVFEVEEYSLGLHNNQCGPGVTSSSQEPLLFTKRDATTAIVGQHYWIAFSPAYANGLREGCSFQLSCPSGSSVSLDYSLSTAGESDLHTTGWLSSRPWWGSEEGNSNSTCLRKDHVSFTVPGVFTSTGDDSSIWSSSLSALKNSAFGSNDNDQIVTTRYLCNAYEMMGTSDSESSSSPSRSSFAHHLSDHQNSRLSQLSMDLKQTHKQNIQIGFRTDDIYNGASSSQVVSAASSLSPSAALNISLQCARPSFWIDKDDPLEGLLSLVLSGDRANDAAGLSLSATFTTISLAIIGEVTGPIQASRTIALAALASCPMSDSALKPTRTMYPFMFEYDHESGGEGGGNFAKGAAFSSALLTFLIAIIANLSSFLLGGDNRRKCGGECPLVIPSSLNHLYAAVLGLAGVAGVMATMAVFPLDAGLAVGCFFMLCLSVVPLVLWLAVPSLFAAQDQGEVSTSSLSPRRSSGQLRSKWWDSSLLPSPFEDRVRTVTLGGKERKRKQAIEIDHDSKSNNIERSDHSGANSEKEPYNNFEKRSISEVESIKSSEQHKSPGSSPKQTSSLPTVSVRQNPGFAVKWTAFFYAAKSVERVLPRNYYLVELFSAGLVSGLAGLRASATPCAGQVTLSLAVLVTQFIYLVKVDPFALDQRRRRRGSSSSSDFLASRLLRFQSLATVLLQILLGIVALVINFAPPTEGAHSSLKVAGVFGIFLCCALFSLLIGRLYLLISKCFAPVAAEHNKGEVDSSSNIVQIEERKKKEGEVNRNNVPFSDAAPHSHPSSNFLLDIPLLAREERDELDNERSPQQPFSQPLTSPLSPWLARKVVIV